MTFQPYDAYAKYAGRGGARNGSPITTDRDFARPLTSAALTIRAVRDLLALVAVFVALALAWSFVPPRPALIGEGCDGAAGPLYAFEESDFPPCVAIRAR